MSVDDHRALALRVADAGAIGVYIHIPFCDVRCWFCEFACFAGLDDLIPRYLDALTAEINALASMVPCPVHVGTIYVGGGTPSMLDPAQLDRVLQAVRSAFVLSPHTEITMEIHPAAAARRDIPGYVAAGVTRLSVGVQSFTDATLRTLGRAHDAREARATLETALASAAPTVSADLIFGIPGQDRQSWERELQEVLAIAPPHVSTYALKRPEGMGQPRKIDELGGLDADAAAFMYADADAMLGESYRWYEVANWALAGHACRYNAGVWQREPYVGFGTSAHGCVRNVRSVNSANPQKYIASVLCDGIPLSSFEVLSDSDIHAERVYLGLRTAQGLPIELVGNRLAGWTTAGLVESDGATVRATLQGRLVADALALDLLANYPSAAMSKSR